MNKGDILLNDIVWGMPTLIEFWRLLVMIDRTWIHRELQRIRNLNNKEEQVRLLKLIDNIIE